MNRLTDSLSVALLPQLGRRRAGEVPRLSSVGTGSLSALKAFLQGEQYFRRTAWDSALSYYGRAAALDGGFALAWRGMSTVLAWSRLRGDSLSLAYGRRAAGLNRGLAPRESLLITAESLSAALYTNSADTAWRNHQARLFATLDAAAHRYPDDAEVWYELGEARFHFRLVGRTTIERVLEAFDRAIALDSAFGVAYLHPIEIAFAVRGPAAVRRYIAAFLAHAPSDQEAETQRLVDRLLAHPEARPPDLERAIDSARTPILFGACLETLSWSDSLETGVRLARAVAASRRSGVELFDDPAARKWLLSEALASRGHLREAYATGGGDRSPLAVLGAVPPDRAAAQFKAWLVNPPVREVRNPVPPNPFPHGFNTALLYAPPWWATQGDSVSLRRFAQRMESLAAGSREYADLRPWFVYAATSARAYLALVRRDSTEALRRFVALPDTICPCAFDQIVTARLLTAAGRPRDPVAVFDSQIPPDGAALGLWRLERARAAGGVGLRAKAGADYEYVAALWRNADLELQPYVAEAKAALTRLASDPRR
jgi:serine/threonine-protein kinase